MVLDLKTALRELKASHHTNEILSSPETTMARKIEAAKAYISRCLIEQIRITYGFGQYHGEFIIPFAYGLDTETTRSMINDIILECAGSGIAISVTAYSNHHESGIQSFKVQWQPGETE